MSLPKATEKLIQYYEESEGNDIAKFKKACKLFIENHHLRPPQTNYQSFKGVYRYHTQSK